MKSGAAHLPPIDGLRGLAAILVWWLHVWQITWLPATLVLFGTAYNFNVLPEDGMVGVDLFFFISGFCLFHPYVRSRFDGSPWQPLGTYALRRAFKILPSYWLAVAVPLALGGLAVYPSPWAAARDVGLHVLFVHNWFPDTLGSINGVLWTLAVEVQFYVVFPLLVRPALARPALVYGGAFAIAIAYRALVYHVPGDRDRLIFLYEQLPGEIDFFAAGMLAAHAFGYVGSRRPDLARRTTEWTAIGILGFAAFALLLQHGFVTRRDVDWPMGWLVKWRTAFALSYVVLTVGTLFAGTPLRRIVANPLFTFASAISYNAYLWHQEVAYTLRQHRIPPWTGATPQGDPRWQVAFTAVAVAAGVAVATLVTYGFERPIVRIGRGIGWLSIRSRSAEYRGRT